MSNKGKRIRGIKGLEYLSREREAWLNYVQGCTWSSCCGFCEVEEKPGKWVILEWGDGCMPNRPKRKPRNCTMRNCPKRKEWWPTK